MAEFKPQEVKGPELPEAAPEFIGTPVEPPSKWQRIKEFLSNNKWYVAAIIVGVLIIGALAAVAFWPRAEERQEEAQIALKIDAAQSVPAGGEVIYKVQIQNQDPAKLVNMELEMVYPDGITYVSSTPKSTNLSGTTFPVPDLGNGQNVTVMIKALAQGNVNDIKKVVARLHYRFENFNSPFISETAHEIRLTAADVVLDLNGPETANNSEVVSYDVLYRNSSKKDVDNSRIQITYPDGFSFADSTPQPSLGQNVWNIGTLRSNDTGKIGFQGSFKNANAGQSYTFKVEYLVLDNEGNFYTQSSTTFTTTIASKPIIVEQKTSGGGVGGVVKPGDTVTVELTYRNNMQVVNTGVQVVAEIDSGSVDFGSIKTETGFVQDGTITWNAAGVSALEKLGPGSSGTVRYTFKVNNPATTNGAKNIEIKLKARIKSNENNTFISGTELPIKISSPSQLETEVLHSGGALPPKVGTPSVFTVTIKLRNSSNDYRDGVLIGYIPTSASLDVNSITQSEKSLVKFDASTGKITWNLGRLAAHSGSATTMRTLQFKVSMTPTANMVGNDAPLFKTISFTATDDFTGQSVNLKTQDLDTGDLPSEENGRVVQ